MCSTVSVCVPGSRVLSYDDSWTPVDKILNSLNASVHYFATGCIMHPVKRFLVPLLRATIVLLLLAAYILLWVVLVAMYLPLG
jgi:hypothetical protein